MSNTAVSALHNQLALLVVVKLCGARDLGPFFLLNGFCEVDEEGLLVHMILAWDESAVPVKAPGKLHSLSQTIVHNAVLVFLLQLFQSIQDVFSAGIQSVVEDVFVSGHIVVLVLFYGQIVS